ncbi:DUF5914 domain-containing protein [Rhodococcus ruber]|uniref:DUF5914 domain-containing protein n=1 Tax=Rhodococcus ruber TaxID=1830 RepID=UPI00265E3238|nr:DUF5914 domain-containing protein [Rhodococcus ruber]MDO1479776.1 Rieske 2Fe-2S domain-containing protein [Rhodococcus ruber]
MSVLDPLYRRWPATWPVQPMDPDRWAAQAPTYRGARPELINAVLDRSQRRPSGNWYVVAASRDIGAERPFGVTVADVELVAWRDGEQVIVGPGACPHLGAPMSLAAVDCGALVCRWHGLRIDAAGAYGWKPFPSHDDGVLVWVRLDHVGGETPTELPVVPERPTADSRIAAVATLVGVCEPTDIVANRLDPWHGAWFHPYSFARLEVVEAPSTHGSPGDEDRFVVDVTFRVAGRIGVPVRAEFTSPEPRTVVMRIVSGEGVGSVVETHATPRGTGPDGRPRTAIVEAVVADSPRPGFGMATRRAAAALRPLMQRTATRLWRDDLDYAERRYQLRAATSPGPVPGR